MIFGEGLRQSDIFSFHIENKYGKIIPPKVSIGNNSVVGYSRIEPGRIVGTSIRLSDWYDLSKIGEYSIKAKWQLSAEGTTYKGASNVINVKIVSKEDKNIFDLIHRATRISCGGESENAAVLKLVEIGQRVVPVILDWLEMGKKQDVPREHPYIIPDFPFKSSASNANLIL